MVPEVKKNYVSCNSHPGNDESKKNDEKSFSSRKVGTRIKIRKKQEKTHQKKYQ